MKQSIITTLTLLSFVNTLLAQDCEDTCGEYPGAAIRDPGPNPCVYAEEAKPGIEKKIAEWECCCKKYREKLEEQQMTSDASMEGFIENLEKGITSTKTDNSNSHLNKKLESEASKINYKDSEMESYIPTIEKSGDLQPETENIKSPEIETIQSSPYQEIKKRAIPPKRLGTYETKKTSSASRGCNEVQNTLILRKSEVEWIAQCDSKRKVGKWKYILNRYGDMVDAEGNIWIENFKNGKQARIEFRGQNIWIHGFDSYIYYKQ